MCDLEALNRSFIIDVSDSMIHKLTLGSNVDDQELFLQVNEFLKFIFLKSIYTLRQEEPVFIPVSREIDEIWHAFILQTKEYQELCDRLPGGVFIHHQSINLNYYIEVVGLRETIKRSLNFLVEYYRYFEAFKMPQLKYWTIPNYLVHQRNIPLELLNEILAKEAQLGPQSERKFENVL